METLHEVKPTYTTIFPASITFSDNWFKGIIRPTYLIFTFLLRNMFLPYIFSFTVKLARTVYSSEGTGDIRCVGNHQGHTPHKIMWMSLQGIWSQRLHSLRVTKLAGLFHLFMEEIMDSTSWDNSMFYKCIFWNKWENIVFLFTKQNINSIQITTVYLYCSGTPLHICSPLINY